MAAFRKLALTVLVLAAFGCVATAGALSQPNRLRFSSDAPRLDLYVGSLRSGERGSYTGTLVVANRSGASARLFVSVRGATAVTLRDRHEGRLLFRGRIVRDAAVGMIPAGATRSVAFTLQATGRSLGFRVSGAAL